MMESDKDRDRQTHTHTHTRDSRHGERERGRRYRFMLNDEQADITDGDRATYMQHSRLPDSFLHNSHLHPRFTQLLPQ